MTTTFPDVSISTERLVLRPFEDADIPALTEMMNDEMVTAWTSVPHPYTTADAQRWVRRIAPAERTEGRGIALAVTEFLTQRLVGIIHLQNTNWRTLAAEVAYVDRSLGPRRGIRHRIRAGRGPVAVPGPEVRAPGTAHRRRQHRLAAGRPEDRLHQRGRPAQRLDSAHPDQRRQLGRHPHRSDRLEPAPRGSRGRATRWRSPDTRPSPTGTDPSAAATRPRTRPVGGAPR